jgi:hypothetical protein
MFEVELDIFSGRPNPRWTLSPQEEQEFLTRLLDKSVPMTSVSAVEGNLGYRGFIVRADGATAGALSSRGLSTTFRVRDGLDRSIDPSSEAWLLYSAEPVGLQREVTSAAKAGIATPADPDKKCKGHFTSSTNFDRWNGEHCTRNNCYNFASNYITDTFAQPGKGAGEMYHAITADEIHKAALRDGYVDECAGGTSLMVGYCIWPGVDYHWYRRTKPMGGEIRWCHKPGGTPARNYDSSGDYITDPSTCDRGGYTIWGGFMFYKGKKNKTVR